MRLLTVIFSLAVLLPLTFESYLLPSNDARFQPVQQESTDANTPPFPNYQGPSAFEHAVIDDGKQGFYIETPKSGLPPAPTPYSAIGAYRFWAWSELQDDDGAYTFDEFDQWLNNQLIAGYQAVGLPIFYLYQPLGLVQLWRCDFYPQIC
ncbi:MAG: hypothetical protein GY759_19780 [Chloroflexi bacterium]|nr:hypothetical protein [Chloroflexota bacterium]